MRGGLAWRLCLFASLLAVGRAEDNYSHQHSLGRSDEVLGGGWKSGAPNNIDESNELVRGDLISPSNVPIDIEPADDKRKAYPGQHFSSYSDLLNNYPYQVEERSESYVPNYNLISPRQDSNAPQDQELIGIPPAIFANGPLGQNDQPLIELWNPSAYGVLSENAGQEALNSNDAIAEKESSDLIETESLDQHPDLQRPLQPVVVPDFDYRHSKGLISKLIAIDDLIHLHNIPGAGSAVNCSKVGDIHRLWQYDGECLVCVCLKEGLFKSVKPVCVSCADCLGPYPQPTRRPVTLPPPPAPSPDVQASCKPLPINEPFQSPLDPCKVCICTEQMNVWGKKGATIRCERNPECVIPPDGTTVSPSPDGPLPLNVCEKLPLNVLFPHPHDACKLCKCSVIQTARGVVEQQVTCYVNPECQPPIVPVTEPHEPENICNNYEVNTLFTDPYDLCRECQCYHAITAGEGRTLQIQCRTKQECIPSPEPILITLPPDNPLPLTCSPIPSGVPFQNPLNPCQVCICTETIDPFGRPDVYIKCDENQECVVPPDVTIPPIHIDPVPLPSCSKLPTNVPFPHPRDSCKTCKCTVQVLPTGPQEFISCYINPDCEMTPKPYEPSICDRYPTNVVFPDPLDECRVCRCTLHTTIYGETERHISCYITPECSSSTIVPVTLLPPNIDEVTCAPLPNGRPFENPLHPCQICVCREILGPSGPDVQIECRESPHCVVPPEITTVPAIDNNTPVPLPACAKYPSNVLFPHPRDACRLCKCTVQLTSHDAPAEYITCFANPECASTTESFTRAPPEPESLTCKPLPSGRPFQSPLNPCEICICIESVNVYGKPDVRIECRANPQCVIPPETVTTVPVIPDNKPVRLPLCTKYPENVLFPHPRDACRLCKCTVQLTSHGAPAEYITCFANPECETTPAPPSPWPPSPPGPLPGPSPHESCSPYAPNKPFQHPWDECQVCVCSEAISIGHITIEVNCFTKKSCCIEIPFDLSELPSSSTGPYIIRPRLDISGSNSGSMDGSIAIGADGQQVDLKEILDPNNIGHYLKPTGHHGAFSYIPGQVHIHTQGSDGGNVNIQDNNERNRIITNDMIHKEPLDFNNQAKSEDFDNNMNNINMYNHQANGVTDYKQYKTPGYIYSGNSQYKIPADIRNHGNKYISSNGQVVVPGYVDQRYITNGHNMNPYILSGNGQEYNYIQGNLNPGGLYRGTEDLGGQINQAYLKQNIRNVKPDWMKWSLDSVHGPLTGNVKGSERMRTKSGRPDSSQSDEASGSGE